MYNACLNLNGLQRITINYNLESPLKNIYRSLTVRLFLKVCFLAEETNEKLLPNVIKSNL